MAVVEEEEEQRAAPLLGSPGEVGQAGVSVAVSGEGDRSVVRVVCSEDSGLVEAWVGTLEGQ